MKKIFTLILLVAAAVSVQAQGFTLYHGTQALADGATYDVGYSRTIPVRAEWDGDLFLECPENGDFMITAEADGNGVQICLPPTCKEVEAGTPLVIVGSLEGGMRNNMQFHRALSGTGPVTGDVKVRLTVQEIIIDDNNAPIGNPVTITVNFLAKTAEEVASIVSVTDGRRPAVVMEGQRTLAYNAASPSRLTLYSVTGATALVRQVSGHGQVSLDRLTPGIYLYRLGNATGKIVVR